MGSQVHNDQTQTAKGKQGEGQSSEDKSQKVQDGWSQQPGLQGRAHQPGEVVHQCHSHSGADRASRWQDGGDGQGCRKICKTSFCSLTAYKLTDERVKM